MNLRLRLSVALAAVAALVPLTTTPASAFVAMPMPELQSPAQRALNPRGLPSQSWQEFRANQFATPAPVVVPTIALSPGQVNHVTVRGVGFSPQSRVGILWQVDPPFNFDNVSAYGQAEMTDAVGAFTANVWTNLSVCDFPRKVTFSAHDYNTGLESNRIEVACAGLARF